MHVVSTQNQCDRSSSFFGENSRRNSKAQESSLQQCGNLSNNLAKLEGRISLSQSVTVVEENFVGLGTEPSSPYKVKL